MNWDAAGAIGEILGSVGVLVTLIYFGIQLRKTQATMGVQSFGTSQQSTFDLDTQIIEHAELIQKADDNEELTAAEEMQLRAIVSNAANHSFFTFLRSQAVGRETLQPMRFFVNFLNMHNSLRAIWLASGSSTTDEPPNRARWKATVLQLLEDGDEGA